MRSPQAGPIGAAMVLSSFVVHCGGSQTGDSAVDAATQDSHRPKSHDASTTDAADVDSTAEDGADAAGDSAENAFDSGPSCLVDAGEAGSGCAAGRTCCGGSCVDATKDPNNCGACGNACSPIQFCAASTCDDAIVANLCVDPKATIVDDQFKIDNAAAKEIAVALMACSPSVSYSTANPDDARLFDQTTHCPLLGPGDTLLMGGGAYGQLSLRYLDSIQATPAYIVEDATTAKIVDRRTRTDVVSDLRTNLTAYHDYFLLVLAVEPVSGTVCFAGAGTAAPGTTAAGYYFANDVMPNLSTYTRSWYVYEWTDVDMNAKPSAADTFTLKGSGK